MGSRQRASTGVLGLALTLVCVACGPSNSELLEAGKAKYGTKKVSSRVLSTTMISSTEGGKLNREPGCRFQGSRPSPSYSGPVDISFSPNSVDIYKVSANVQGVKVVRPGPMNLECLMEKGLLERIEYKDVR
jgi:hypothetical protein